MRKTVCPSVIPIAVQSIMLSVFAAIPFFAPLIVHSVTLFAIDFVSRLNVSEETGLIKDLNEISVIIHLSKNVTLGNNENCHGQIIN